MNRKTSREYPQLQDTGQGHSPSRPDLCVAPVEPAVGHSRHLHLRRHRVSQRTQQLVLIATRIFLQHLMPASLSTPAALLVRSRSASTARRSCGRRARRSSNPMDGEHIAIGLESEVSGIQCASASTACARVRSTHDESVSNRLACRHGFAVVRRHSKPGASSLMTGPQQHSLPRAVTIGKVGGGVTATSTSESIKGLRYARTAGRVAFVRSRWSYAMSDSR